MKATDLPFADESAMHISDPAAFLDHVAQFYSHPDVNVTVRDMGRDRVDGGWPHVDIDGPLPAVTEWLMHHYGDGGVDEATVLDILSQYPNTGIEEASPAPTATPEWRKVRVESPFTPALLDAPTAVKSQPANAPAKGDGDFHITEAEMRENVKHGGFYAKFNNYDNIWNRYEEFKSIRSSTDKLAATLTEINRDHMFVEGGDVAPHDGGWEILQVTFTGGRDWHILLGIVGA